MKLGIWLSVLLISLYAYSVQAPCEELVAIHPGVMCVSAEVLARRILPGGDSRTHAAIVSHDASNLAASGGCVDIRLGMHVTVRETSRNTSLVTHQTGSAEDGRVFVAPNIDFESVASHETTAGTIDAPTHAVPTGEEATAALAQGYRISQRIEASRRTGTYLEILVDARLTADLRDLLWGSGDGADVLPQGVSHEPLRTAQVRLVSAAGVVLASRVLDDHPLARLDAARLRGLPSPAWLLTIDESTGMGSYNGPMTEILVPAQLGVQPVSYTTTGGERLPIFLGHTGKADWKVVPGRKSGLDDIEFVFCEPDANGAFVTTYRTYRFAGSTWRVVSRQSEQLWEAEDGFPEPGDFP